MLKVTACEFVVSPALQLQRCFNLDISAGGVVLIRALSVQHHPDFVETKILLKNWIHFFYVAYAAVQLILAPWIIAPDQYGSFHPAGTRGSCDWLIGALIRACVSRG